MADAVALHGALGGDERTVLVGHDWGAITANALGAHPDSPYQPRGDARGPAAGRDARRAGPADRRGSCG